MPPPIKCKMLSREGDLLFPPRVLNMVLDGEDCSWQFGSSGTVELIEEDDDGHCHSSLEFVFFQLKLLLSTSSKTTLLQVWSFKFKTDRI